MVDKKITTIGEALIDWVCLDKTLDLYEATEFIKAPGGAPANVAIGLAKLNYPIQFVGGFSNDIFGKWLKEYITSFNVDISLSIDIANSNTRNAYIMTDKNGNRVLKCFSMQCCADSMISVDDINMFEISQSPLVYFGSLLQVNEASRFTLNNIINTINSNNIILYDPNLRLCMWPSKETAVNIITETFYMVDIVKLSDDELEWITGNSDVESAAKAIFEDYHLKLVVITMGSKGSFFVNKNGSGFVRSFKVETVEETGAGDGFVAGILGSLYDVIVSGCKPDCSLDNLLVELSPVILDKILTRANAIGALTTTKPGATTALPIREELDKFLNSRC